MIPALYALAASVFLGTSDFLGGTLARRLPLLTVLLLAQVVGVVASLTSFWFSQPGGDLLSAAVWGALSGLAVAIALAALYRALAIGTMGIVAPLASLSVLVPVTAGLLDSDRLSLQLGLGMVLAIAGTALASGPELRGGTGSGPSIGLALLSAAGFGVASLAIARGSAEHLPTTLIGNTTTALGVYLVAALVVRPSLKVATRDLTGVAAIGVLGFGANLCFGLASQAAQLSVVAVLASLFPVVTALLGGWFHRERLGRIQFLGVTATIVGVIVLATA